MRKSEHENAPRSIGPKTVVPDQQRIPSPPDTSELLFDWWPSSSFPTPWWPKFQETFADLFKRAHRILTTNGFLVVDDPYNESGDGKSWRLICKTTSKFPPRIGAADFARQCLELEHIKVQAVEPKEGALYIYLYPPTTMEDRLGEAWKQAKASVAIQENETATSTINDSAGLEKRVARLERVAETRKPKYRSKFKRAISKLLHNRPDATTQIICAHVDEQFGYRRTDKSWILQQHNKTKQHNSHLAMISQVRGDIGLTRARKKT